MATLVLYTLSVTLGYGKSPLDDYRLPFPVAKDKAQFSRNNFYVRNWMKHARHHLIKYEPVQGDPRGAARIEPMLERWEMCNRIIYTYLLHTEELVQNGANPEILGRHVASIWPKIRPYLKPVLLYTDDVGIYKVHEICKQWGKDIMNGIRTTAFLSSPPDRKRD